MMPALRSRSLFPIIVGGAGQEVRFGLGEESDGTRRLMELGPEFLAASLSGSQKVVVIDELDRSLHTLLTRRLLEGYLAGCSPRS